MSGSRLDGRLDGLGTLIEVAKKIIERPIHAHIDVNRNMNRLHLDGLGLDRQATRQREQQHTKQHDSGAHQDSDVAFRLRNSGVVAKNLTA